MRLTALLVSVVALLAVVGPTLVSRAATDDTDSCVNGTGDEQIAARTGVINSGRFQGRNQAISYGNRGNAYYDKMDYDRAIADVNEAIRLDPKHANAYNGRGTVYRAEGDNDRAISDFNEAIRLDPKDPDAYYNRGLAKRATGDAAGGDADIAKAEQLKPGIGN